MIKTNSIKHRFMTTTSGEVVDLLPVYKRVEATALELAKEYPKNRAIRLKLDDVRTLISKLEMQGL